MRDGTRGRPRKDENVNGSVSDDATYLTFIWEAEGNVSKAAANLGHEGTKSFYNVLTRLRKRINGPRQLSDPSYDFLYTFDKKLQKPLWTENGLKLVRAGQELLKAKRTFDNNEKVESLRNIHFTLCKAPLYPNTEILVTEANSKSKFEVYFMCKTCGMMIRNILTAEFLKWQEEHPEQYSTPNRTLIEIRDTSEDRE